VIHAIRLSLRFGLRATVVVLVLLSWIDLVSADPPQDEKSRAEEFAIFAKREAAAYAINLEGIDEPLKLQPEPVLKWSNPVVGSIYGDVFIWTDHGRPSAVASIYRFYTPPVHRANEFHSLALGPLAAKRNGFVVWTPTRAGLELKPIPEAAAPADSAPARLRQMRAIAQEFTGRQTTREGVDRDMRLLAQPIYRYENTRGDLFDGGLFVFVVGTDPEVFLLIEARRQATGVPEWRFAATRMNNVNLRLDHRGRQIWNMPELPWPQVYDSSQPYAVFGYDVESDPKK
jgi:hypothetical protein